jgi:hypothetical protein
MYTAKPVPPATARRAKATLTMVASTPKRAPKPPATPPAMRSVVLRRNGPATRGLLHQLDRRGPEAPGAESDEDGTEVIVSCSTRSRMCRCSHALHRRHHRDLPHGRCSVLGNFQGDPRFHAGASGRTMSA